MLKLSEEHMTLMQDKAEFLRALAHPIRLCILNQLINDGEKNVSDIVSCMGYSQSNISQHLTKLRDLGLVVARKQGYLVYYSCERDDVKSLLNLLLEGEN